MTPAHRRPAASLRGRDNARVVEFDARKYGRYLLADAARTDALPGFITSPEPHRLTFFEIALIERGSGCLRLDGEALAVGPLRVIVTAPGEARSWQLCGSRLCALLAFFDPAALDGVLAGAGAAQAFPFLAASRAARAVSVTHAQFRRLADLVLCMQEEFRRVRADSARIVEAQLYHLLLLLQRHFAGARLTAADPAAVLSRRFSELVEARGARWATVAQYASALHVSSRHLNACTRRATGRTASATIHDRLILEAQRRLLGSSQSVAAIAEELGFSDASYFVRFFRHRTGWTPAAFRRDRGNPIADPLCD